MSLAADLEQLAALLEAASTRRNPLRKILSVHAASGFDRSGKPVNPVPIRVGDPLHVQRPSDPAAGAVSKNAAGRKVGAALQALAAGEVGDIAVGLYEKRWVTDGNPCEECDENALAGWIPADEEFPSGHDEPEAHPNCKCSMDMRRGG